jgi:hypothetical protein
MAAPRYHFFLPVNVLSRVFRRKFVAGLKRRFRQRQLTFAGTQRSLENQKAFHAFLRPLFRHNWIVYAKPPFGGPQHVLGYLARYTHRVAITNHRLVAFDGQRVTFRWKDYAHGNNEENDDLGRARVSATLLITRSAPWLRSHPLVRIPGQSPPSQTSSSLSAPVAE